MQEDLWPVVGWWSLDLVGAGVAFVAFVRWLMGLDHSWRPPPKPPADEILPSLYAEETAHDGSRTAESV